MQEIVLDPYCRNCAYSDDGNSPADPKDGEWLLCRRRPPIVFAASDDGYDGGKSVFPRVAYDDWCGEWVQHCINTHESEQRSYLVAQLEIYRSEIEEDAQPHEETGQDDGRGSAQPGLCKKVGMMQR